MELAYKIEEQRMSGFEDEGIELLLMHLDGEHWRRERDGEEMMEQR
jgi:hypothetical protein